MAHILPAGANAPTCQESTKPAAVPLAGYVAWATSTLGAPLNRADLFYPDLINRYAQFRWGTAKSIAFSGTRLLKLGSTLGDYPVAQMRRSPRQVSAPYSAVELRGYDAWARHAPTPYRRKLYATIVALAAGAGLRAREILDLRSTDVDQTEHGFLIHVRGVNARTVPLRHDWEGLLRTAQPFPNDWVCTPRARNGERPSSLASSFSNRHAAPRLQRLRGGWIVNLMQRLPAADVIAAAGLQTISSLNRYETYTSSRDWETLTPLLRSAPVEAV